MLSVLRYRPLLFFNIAIALNACAFFATWAYATRQSTRSFDKATDRDSTSTVDFGNLESSLLISDDILVTMEDTNEYDLYGDKANAEWLATTPDGNGYVHVGESHRLETVAFGHEMHCIRTIRMAIAYPLHPNATVEHASHCLNYLRMYILCNPDLTMERFDPLERNFSSDAYGATHICRLDWKRVYEGLAKNVALWVDPRKRNSSVN